MLLTHRMLNTGYLLKR